MISKEQIGIFLSQKYPNVEGSSYTRLENTLEKVFEYEQIIDMPFERFSQQDFINMFESNNWTATNTFVSNKSVVKDFAEWYFQSVIGLDNIKFGYPKVSPVTYVELEDVSSEERYKREYYKDADDFFDCLEEMLGLITEDQWVMNKTFYVLMWEGLNRKEIRFLKIDDVDAGIDTLSIKLPDRNITVTEKRSIEIIKQAISVSGYDIVQKNGKQRGHHLFLYKQHSGTNIRTQKALDRKNSDAGL